MSFYQRSQQSNQQNSWGNNGGGGGGSGARNNNNRKNNMMQSQLQFAGANDYQTLITHDGIRLGWFFKQSCPAYKCFHGENMERPEGVFTVQCTDFEGNCGAKIFEGSSSVMSLCTPTEISGLNGPERILLGIVPILFCLKNANLHIILSSVQGKLIMKCQDSSCPVIESTIDCDSYVAAPRKLMETLSKVYAIRDRLSRQAFLFELLDFVRQRNFRDLDDPMLNYPSPKIQKTNDLMAKIAGTLAHSTNLGAPLPSTSSSMMPPPNKKMRMPSVEKAKKRQHAVIVPPSLQPELASTKSSVKKHKTVTIPQLPITPNISDDDDDTPSSVSSDDMDNYLS
jgi:hypothetical protein